MGIQSSVNQVLNGVGSIASAGTEKPNQNAYANELLKEAQRKRLMARRAAFDKSQERADYTKQRIQKAKAYQASLKGGKK